MFDEKPKKDILNVSKIKCSNCNYSFYTSSSNSVSRCVVCNSGRLEQNKGEQDITDCYVLSFRKSISDARKEYQKKIKYNPFIPFVFRKKATMNCISKIYVPALLVDFNMKGDVDFLAGDKVGVVNNGKKQVENRKFAVSATVNFDYRKLPLCISSLISNTKFNSISKFNFNNLQKFSDVFVQNVSVMNSNLDIAEVGNRNRDYIVGKSLQLVKDNIPHQLKKVVNNKADIMFSNSVSVLLPFYYFSFKYGKSNYTFIMNGETGESTFDLAFGKLEIILFGLLLVAFVFGFIFLIFNFL